MKREMLRAKMHRIAVTERDVDYEGSLSLDSDLMRAAEMLPFEKVDVYDVMAEVATLLDDSVAADGYVIREHLGEPIDLSKIDFEELRRRFAKGRKHIEVEKLSSSAA